MSLAAAPRSTTLARSSALAVLALQAPMCMLILAPRPTREVAANDADRQRVRDTFGPFSRGKRSDSPASSARSSRPPRCPCGMFVASQRACGGRTSTIASRS